MVTREAFQHFNTNHGLVVEDNYHEYIVKPMINKVKHTKFLAEYAFKCMGGMSKRDYARCRFTHEILCNKLDSLYQVRTESEDIKFQQGWRRLQISKGLYPFGLDVDEAIENYQEIRDYYLTGFYMPGGFVDKYIQGIHKI